MTTLETALTNYVNTELSTTLKTAYNAIHTLLLHNSEATDKQKAAAQTAIEHLLNADREISAASRALEPIRTAIIG